MSKHYGNLFCYTASYRVATIPSYYSFSSLGSSMELPHVFLLQNRESFHGCMDLQVKLLLPLDISMVFSLYIFFGYFFFPLFGLLADVWIGRYKAILIGIVLYFISWIIAQIGSNIYIMY